MSAQHSSLDLSRVDGRVHGRPGAARLEHRVDLSFQRRQNYTMLYIEDNPPNIELMQGLIDALDGIRLLTATHADVGLEPRQRTHLPDVIVLDIDLPDMNGAEVLKKLKATPATADIPVMALSAAAMPQDIERGLGIGFTHYLTKPIKVREFFAAIESVLRESQRDQKRT